AWLDEHDFDVLHLHEPAAPSLSLLTLWAAEVPVVATFHSSQSRSVALRAAQPLLQPGLDKISARIAVSESAHDTMAAHVGATTVCIPNGVYVDRFCPGDDFVRSEEHTSELQSRENLVCRLLLEKKKTKLRCPAQ